MQLTQHELPSPRRMNPAMQPALPEDPLVLAWREIDAALVPIVGERGAAALYQRCLHLLSGSDAAAGTLLQTAREVLIPLIGAGLTDRLLPLPSAGLSGVSEKGDRWP